MPKEQGVDTLVQFTKPFQSYNAGEKATFKAQRARELIEAGVAQEPGVIAKATAAAKAVLDRRQTTKRKPEPGKKASFFVPGLGDTTGTIVAGPKDGLFKIEVGTGADVDQYEVEESALTVLE
jgi:hypothetical protein